MRMAGMQGKQVVRVVRVVRGAVMLGAALAAVTGAVPAVAAGQPRAGEADLAYHGEAAMTGGRVDLRVTPRNHGPADVEDATVRIRWSTALQTRQTLPSGCTRADVRTVLCGTGALPADGAGEQLRLRVRLRGAPSEVRVDLETAWTGDATDHNRVNDRQHVLILDTGDAYNF